MARASSVEQQRSGASGEAGARTSGRADGPRPVGRVPAAAALRPLITALFGGEPPVRFEFWDGTALGPPGGPGTAIVRSSDALRRVLWAPGELGLGRAYVSGDLDAQGDLFAVLRLLRTGVPWTARRRWVRALPRALAAAAALGLLGPPPPPPAIEARPHGRRHSPSRDEAAVTHHYDVGNDFYRLVLGPSMTYSCARFVDDSADLEAAQAAKHDLVCRKLGLHQRPGARLLDVGCGWGSMAIHAAGRYGARVVGMSLSRPQVALARRRVEEAGLSDLVELRVQDYRRLGGQRFDAISSIGMFEHVGAASMGRYFRTLHALLEPGGRLCNHAISEPRGSRLGSRTFVGRYVFPDGELVDVGRVVLAMEAAGFEVRDVESLREHYSRTLHAWVANLQDHWDEAVGLVGEPRARAWRLYMAASANGFDDGGIAVHQVLGVKPTASGRSGMPPTRRDWD